MLTFDQAIARILTDVLRLPSESVELSDAVGRVLAENVTTSTPIPPFDASAMDGYAVATSAFAGDGPWTFPVRGESSPGSRPAPLDPHTTCRILTGAPLPTNANAVVMQEEVTRTDEEVTFRSVPRETAHVRRAGEDLAVGGVGIAAGMRMGPAQLSMAAMLDRAMLSVARRPRVCIVATGNELRAPGAAGGPSMIPESNGAGVSALAIQAGAIVTRTPVIPDEAAVLTRAIAEALSSCDVLVTLGGVSVGDHDHVRGALAKAGVTIDFWKVALKPGKPLAIGRTQTAHVVALPGNPVSALVTFAFFGVPLLRAMQGDSRPRAWAVELPLARRIDHKAGRTELLRVSVVSQNGRVVLEPHPHQSAGALIGLSEADAIAIVPPELGAVEAGHPLLVVRLSDV